MDKSHRIEGAFFKPLSSQSQRARLTIAVEDNNAPSLSLDLEDGTHFDRLVVEDFQGGDNLHILGGCYFKADQPLSQAARELLTSKTRQHINRLEMFSYRKAAIFAVLLVLCVLGVRVGIPYASSGLAAIVPNSLEEAIGAHTYDTIKRIDLEPSKLPQEQQDRLRQRAYAMAKSAHLTRHPTIYFHRSSLQSGNAFALPGGPIVVTDKLVTLLGNDEEVLAVLAHEMSHVELRHSLQQLVRVAGAATLASVVFGADDGLLEELSGTLLNVWSFKNSRNFEKEADLKGVAILRAGHLPPEALLHAIRKLHTQDCNKLKDSAKAKCITQASQGETGWMSSHPGAKDRLEYLRAATQN